MMVYVGCGLPECIMAIRSGFSDGVVVMIHGNACGAKTISQ